MNEIHTALPVDAQGSTAAAARGYSSALRQNPSAANAESVA